MDINTLRAAVTLLSFIAFAGIVVWALSRRNQADFDEAAMLPFAAEAQQQAQPQATADSATKKEAA